MGCLGNGLPEVYTVENGTLCKKTHLNDHILEEYKISVPEYIESKEVLNGKYKDTYINQ